jgi:hypothetical protein
MRKRLMCVAACAMVLALSSCCPLLMASIVPFGLLEDSRRGQPPPITSKLAQQYRDKCLQPQGPRAPRDEGQREPSQ